VSRKSARGPHAERHVARGARRSHLGEVFGVRTSAGVSRKSASVSRTPSSVSKTFLVCLRCVQEVSECV
jgi:hypothetical protein